ncbi:MAG: DnaA regulatory inactivator Hda, partial [Halioglobus sp.]|nr:DnaA regulatory inactivator Hda [Halioglobus sp.]
MTRSPSVRCQIPLAVQLRDEATLDNFLAVPAVAPLLRALRGQLRHDGEATIFLFGPAGAGKTHLLQAACHLAGARAQYLPLAELRECAAQEVLQG